jgi:hypothetical protein
MDTNNQRIRAYFAQRARALRHKYDVCRLEKDWGGMQDCFSILVELRRAIAVVRGRASHVTFARRESIQRDANKIGAVYGLNLRVVFGSSKFQSGIGE